MTVSTSVEQRLLAARVFDGFWERWLAHGVLSQDIAEIRPRLITEQAWLSCWTEAAERLSQSTEEQRPTIPSENCHRRASLYYYLAQWILPLSHPLKKPLYRKSMEYSLQADTEQPDREIVRPCLRVDQEIYCGVLHIPPHPKGCVLILAPIDSAKEELYCYIEDFVSQGLVAMLFDGPGQGESAVLLGGRATRQRWEAFIETQLDYLARSYPSLPTFLFGTSSGAAWTLFASSDPRIRKGVAVSPAFWSREKTEAFPSHFLHRLQELAEAGEPVGESILPDFYSVRVGGSLWLFHGARDSFVTSDDIETLAQGLGGNCRVMIYPDEGHCCNFRLREIRRLSAAWFLQEGIS